MTFIFIQTFIQIDFTQNIKAFNLILILLKEDLIFNIYNAHIINDIKKSIKKDTLF